MAENTDLEQAHEIGKLKSEVHTLNTLVSKLFEKFDSFAEKMQPKQIGFAGYVGIAVSVMGIFALLFGSVMFITTSSNAPIMAQMSQITKTLAAIQNNSVQNSNENRLISKELSGIAKSVNGNADTLHWIVYQKELPTKIVENELRIEVLSLRMEEMKQLFKEKERGK